MNFGAIKSCDTGNGPGVRVSLFVSGCRNRCKGCFQPETWDFNYGKRFDRETMNEIIELLAPDYISGLTILGGDPMEPENRDIVKAICKIVRTMYPSKSIWVYTGYLFEGLLDEQGDPDDVLYYIDVLVDGPFVEEKKVLGEFRGSSNQRFIDVPASIIFGQVEELKHG